MSWRWKPRWASEEATATASREYRTFAMTFLALSHHVERKRAKLHRNLLEGRHVLGTRCFRAIARLFPS